jgi:CRISPR-associated endonuclease Cas2
LGGAEPTAEFSVGVLAVQTFHTDRVKEQNSSFVFHLAKQSKKKKKKIIKKSARKTDNIIIYIINNNIRKTMTTVCSGVLSYPGEPTIVLHYYLPENH